MRGRSLELDQDLPFQRRLWKFQHIAWFIMLAALIAALLGAFGSGRTSDAAAGNASAFRVEYQRFMRQESTSPLRVLFAAPGASGQTVRIWFDREYLESVRGQGITPHPERVEAAGDRRIYSFPIAPGSRHSAVALEIFPLKPGILHFRAGIAGGPEVTFTQFVYP